jgi:transposase
MRPAGSQKMLESRRQRAIDLLKEGYQPYEVAHKLGVDRRSVRRWKAAHREDGIQALKAKPVPGRPARMDAKKKIQLEKLLLKGAQSAGFPTDLWTCPRIAHAISSHFGVTYHVDYIGPLLRSLGWSPQKPQHRALERDEKGIQRWIKKTWPLVKKNQPSKGTLTIR